jgi:hypothetical protein
MALHAAYTGLKLPRFGNGSGRANRFYVAFLAILAAAESIGLRWRRDNHRPHREMNV